MRPLVVLGATGSIGTQTLEVARRLGVEVRVVAARRGSPGLLAVAEDWPDALVAVADPTDEELATFDERFGRRLLAGPDALAESAAMAGTTVVNGVVGAAGLRPTLAALEAGNRLALANKESMVAGGPLVRGILDRRGGELIPVDSEHSALFQCLVGESLARVRKLILTASGGPFFGRSREDMADVTPAEALAHPTWAMGRRISIDSATLLNKGFEVIEANMLFNVPYDAIEVVVHPQSVVHSLVEFVDGALKAHLGEPDMRIPIQYAVTFPDRAPGVVEPFSILGRAFEFHAPDSEAFPALALAYEAGRQAGSSPAVLNAADEIAVEAFLEGRIPFIGIPTVLIETLERVPWRGLEGVDDVAAADEEARRVAAETIDRMRR